MKFWRFAVAFLFTFLLLGLARKTTMMRSAHEAVEQQGILIDHHTVPKQVGDEVPTISAKVTGASEVRLVYKIGKDGKFQSVPMNPKPGEVNAFTAPIPHYPKPTKAWYYIEARKTTESAGVTVTLPDKGSPDFKPILLKFEGKVPVYIIIPHVLCNFGAIFFAVLTLFSALDIRKGKKSLRESIKFPLLTFILLFLGFVPFGIAMNHFAFGATWEAFPFGKDVTDNKSQIILLVWLITLFLVKGTLLGQGAEKNLVSHRGYSTMVIISFIVTIGMYAIPHSFVF
ncbi:MAG: hypothetical protein WCE90_10090 [Candidatus Zixiibacteriota bacterium]